MVDGALLDGRALFDRQGLYRVEGKHSDRWADLIPVGGVCVPSINSPGS